MSEGRKLVASNRRARFDFALEDTWEAGIVLTGSEVKSLRGGRASLNEAFARVEGNEVWLENMHIPPYEPAGKTHGYDPRRPRKLLMHKREIQRLIGKTAEKGLTLVPVRVYFKNGLAKVEVGLGRGKAKYEKRQTLKLKEHQREIEKGFGSARKRTTPPAR